MYKIIALQVLVLLFTGQCRFDGFNPNKTATVPLQDESLPDLKLLENYRHVWSRDHYVQRRLS